MPPAGHCVLPLVLRRFASRMPERIFAVFEDGEQWSYARTLQESLQLAGGLELLGVARGDTVLIWLPNGKLALKAWFGTNQLGAVSVAINTAYRGELLRHVVCNSDARVAICHADLVDRLLDIEDRGALEVVVTTPDKAEACSDAFAAAGIQVVSAQVLDTAPAASGEPDLAPWDLQSICYTSGTTGPSKGVLTSYLHLHTMGWNCTTGVEPHDRYLINLPLFHVGGTLFVTGALARGASIAVMSAFSTDRFLSVCRELRATQCLLLGAMASFLVRTPPAASDRDHGMRRVMVIPLAEDPAALTRRFGFEVFTLFNMSEISAPIVSEINPTTRGSCGRLLEGYEARIVDENDCEVPPGASGELVLRAACPWSLSHGYHRMPEATARAWRNGWFHTGDVFRVDESGNYFFVDRLKDAIRRRGENISSFEVEAQVLTWPAVLETAVVGVPSEHGEEEVLAVVVPKDGMSIEPEVLVHHLARHLPHFMVPRYVRVIGALPKTPTSKVEKHALRAEGVTADTWDRAAAGIHFGREKLD